jgi:aerobic carbon-monoxide dehydrogenase medium subunit
MKCPPLSYRKAQSLADIFSAIALHGDQLRILAGGQTLLPSLNMRLSEPKLLIDIRAISELQGIEVVNGMLRIGALATHSQIEASALVARHAPLLAQAVPHIAHRAIRNLGTLGGSIAYADPAAEWPTCAVALCANIIVRSAEKERRIPADEFFLGLYTTAMRAEEIVMACEFPLIQAQQKHDFSELARRHGDYALAGLAVCSEPGKQRFVFLGISDRPVRALHAESIVSATGLTKESIDEAVASLKSELEPMADLTHNEDSKLHLAGVLLRRALLRIGAVQ